MTELPPEVPMMSPAGPAVVGWFGKIGFGIVGLVGAGLLTLAFPHIGGLANFTPSANASGAPTVTVQQPVVQVLSRPEIEQIAESKAAVAVTQLSHDLDTKRAADQLLWEEKLGRLTDKLTTLTDQLERLTGTLERRHGR
uniref:Uncharacterized protein n=1 Tax=uncultured Caudovirales phage TaxID=2100421 RepID=A0A6J5L1I9_9CAUD|nr:hypothetical protein UFOVP114_36 [uncultured Caudovirales phage]